MPLPFKRAIHLPKRGIGDARTRKTGRKQAQQEQLTLLAYCETARIGEAPLAHSVPSQFPAKEWLSRVVTLMQSLHDLAKHLFRLLLS